MIFGGKAVNGMLLGGRSLLSHRDYPPNSSWRTGLSACLSHFVWLWCEYGLDLHPPGWQKGRGAAKASMLPLRPLQSLRIPGALQPPAFPRSEPLLAFDRYSCFLCRILLCGTGKRFVTCIAAAGDTSGELPAQGGKTLYAGQAVEALP